MYFKSDTLVKLDKPIKSWRTFHTLTNHLIILIIVIFLKQKYYRQKVLTKPDKTKLLSAFKINLMSSLSRLIFWNFSRCYTYCQSKSFYWQNKGFAARSEKAPSIIPKGLGLDLIPHFDPSVLVKWKMIQILSRNAEQMIGHATCWHKEFCQTLVLFWCF